MTQVLDRPSWSDDEGPDLDEPGGKHLAPTSPLPLPHEDEPRLRAALPPRHLDTSTPAYGLPKLAAAGDQDVLGGRARSGGRA